jgi:FkbM family methyltransferase
MLERVRNNRLFLRAKLALDLSRCVRAAEPELQVVGALCSGSRVAVDVGAHSGLYTYCMLKRCAIVHAFEPNVALVSRLRRTFSENVVVHQCALSDREGPAEFYIPLDGDAELAARGSLLRDAEPGHTLNTVHTNCRTLDSFDISDVGFVKIDVEGHELSVIRGAVGTLTKNRPALLVEIEDRHQHGQCHKVFDFLEGLGYSGFFLFEGKAHELSEFRVAVHQAPGHRKAPSGDKNPQYVNNFLFLHRTRSDLFRSLESAQPGFQWGAVGP